MSFPTYVWQWLRQQSKLHDEPQNVIVLKALKEAGCPIPDHHLIDGPLRLESCRVRDRRGPRRRFGKRLGPPQ